MLATTRSYLRKRWTACVSGFTIDHAKGLGYGLMFWLLMWMQTWPNGGYQWPF